MSELDVERLRDMAALREAARREAEDNARHPRRSFRIETELVTYRAAVDALTADDWQALARLAESRPSDGLAAAVIEWADSEEVVRQNPSPSREEWHRVLVARKRLRELRAALTEPDSAETPNP